jgi:D-glycero-D-manno-heptose 1,7-bisphosphate phosphatase
VNLSLIILKKKINNSFEVNKALFLDRDGVINEEVGYIYNIEKFQFKPGIVELISMANCLDYKVIVITNQGGISKGLYTQQDLQKIHDFMLARLEGFGAFVDKIYYCPHHPDQTRCLCRKPEKLFFERAIHSFHIDPKLSFMLGDKQHDLTPAKLLGITTVLVGVQDPMYSADYYCPEISDVLSILV